MSKIDKNNDFDVLDDDFEAEMPDVNSISGKNKGGAQKLGIVIIGVITLLALLAVNGVFSSKKDEAPKRQTETIASRMPPMPPLPEPPRPKVEPKPIELMAQTVAPPPPVTAPTRGGNQKMPPTPEERKMLPSLVAFSAKKDSRGNETHSEASRSDGETSVANDLSASLKPAMVKGSKASIMVDRTFMLTQGQFLDCVLETAIDSTVSGMVRARLSKDAYSADGRMVLLEKGTKIVGQYQHGITKGQARLFILWTRAETPKGVIVNIDSLGADELGRSGVDGWIDYHFWERFGSAILFSLIDDLGQYIVNEAKGQTAENNIRLDSTSDSARNTAGIALENSINIPPTLRKNQGDNISIFIARDLDFRGVYDIDFQ